jgi:hypothetical protein
VIRLVLDAASKRPGCEIGVAKPLPRQSDIFRRSSGGGSERLRNIYVIFL